MPVFQDCPGFSSESLMVKATPPCWATGVSEDPVSLPSSGFCNELQGAGVAKTWVLALHRLKFKCLYALGHV